MFRAVKPTCALDVLISGSTVRVIPARNAVERGLVQRTLARCEEFLAQVMLQNESAKDQLACLIRHFRSRGWQVLPGVGVS